MQTQKHPRAKKRTSIGSVLRYTSFFFLIFFLSGAPSGAFELRYTSFFFLFFFLSEAYKLFFLSGALSGAFELRYTSFFFPFFPLSGAFEGRKKGQTCSEDTCTAAHQSQHNTKAPD
jgi:hypothetical protein